jgi:crotonobetainyl-CoA:carnitine CoA-transferase CaiB-like acyl-CoA transferase
VQGPPPEIGAHKVSSLQDWGFDPAAVQDLKKDGVI